MVKRENGGERCLVNPYEGYGESLHYGSFAEARVRTALTSSPIFVQSISEDRLGALPIYRRTIPPALMRISCCRSRNASRIHRFMRFRTAAFLIPLTTVNPTPCSPGCIDGTTKSLMEPAVIAMPRAKISAKAPWPLRIWRLASPWVMTIPLTAHRSRSICGDPWRAFD